MAVGAPSEPVTQRKSREHSKGSALDLVPADIFISGLDKDVSFKCPGETGGNG